MPLANTGAERSCLVLRLWLETGKNNKIMKLRATIAAISILAALCSGASVVQAIPVLQIYIEGADYDPDSDTWITNQSSFKLWVIGNVSGQGSHGPILDVKLSAAYFTGETGDITITPTTTALLTDPSAPVAPVLNGAVGADGTVPVMSDGNPLEPHGIFGPGVSFKQWELGDMTLSDSPMADFGGLDYPSSFADNTGQINVYDVTVTGYTSVHFDAFNHTDSPVHAWKAPYSHDAGGVPVPEPASLVLLGLGMAGTAFARGIKRRR
jgi:hypothetical protein